MALTEEQELEYRALAESKYAPEPFKNYISRVTPKHPAPSHVQPLIDVFERIQRGEVVQVLVSMPPRHAKTETIKKGLAYLMENAPAEQHAFVSNGANYAVDRAREIRNLITLSGKIRVFGPGENTRTPQGGRLKALGVGGQYVGTGTTGLQVIDDPYPTPKDALSANFRDGVWAWFNGSARNRREPGSSCMVCHTRWHPDDLIGRLIREEGEDWEVINLPAVEGFDEGVYEEYKAIKKAGESVEDFDLSRIGTALWPGYYPMAELTQHMREKYYWWALFMGSPRALGDKLFDEPSRFQLSEFKLAGKRACICLDPAATKSTKADHSAMGVFAMEGYGDESRMYVLYVKRMQETVPVVARATYALQKKGGPRQLGKGLLVVVEAVGAFKAVPQILRELEPKLRIHEISPTSDKFVRAQPVSGAWNEGRVLVADDEIWEGEFIEELGRFTGVDDPQDDQADVLAHAWNTLYREKPARKRGPRANYGPAPS